MDKKVITLLKRQCYVDGQWVGEPALSVTNPGHRRGRSPRCR